LERVVFACVHNAGRSKMAAAFFNRMADPDLARAVSAGTRPAASVHPQVVEAMREVGVDLSGEKPALLTSEVAGGAKLLITMGCGEECPVIPGARREDWPLADPAGRDLSHVREIRDQIQERVRNLIAREGWRKLESSGERKGAAMRHSRL
jgi:arsenate reductase